jgi:hypothetical protein
MNVSPDHWGIVRAAHLPNTLRSTISRHLGRGFAENPVGVTSDPEELCRRSEAGASMTDLLRIPPMPEGHTPWDMLAKH